MISIRHLLTLLVSATESTTRDWDELIHTMRFPEIFEQALRGQSLLTGGNFHRSLPSNLKSRPVRQGVKWKGSASGPFSLLSKVLRAPVNVA